MVVLVLLQVFFTTLEPKLAGRVHFLIQVAFAVVDRVDPVAEHVWVKVPPALASLAVVLQAYVQLIPYTRVLPATQVVAPVLR